MHEVFRSAFANILKDKGSSVVHVLGLTVILTLGFVLLFNIIYENGYDKHHVKHDRLYRIASVVKNSQDESSWSLSQASLAPELIKQCRGVKNAARFWSVGKSRFGHGTVQAEERSFYFADPSVLSMFSYRLLAGSLDNALSAPFSMVITRSIAEKYFGHVYSDCIGKKLVNQKGEAFMITAVINNEPGNTHFSFDALISSATGYGLNAGWGNFSAYTYIELSPDCGKQSVNAMLNRIASEKTDDLTNEFDVRISYQLQPLTEIHRRNAGRNDHAGIETILILCCLAAIMIWSFVILPAKKTREEKRFLSDSELSRKISSHRKGVILQSATESLYITIIAFVLSAVVLNVVLPFVNELVGKKIPICYLWDGTVIILVLSVMIFSAVAGALYPSVYLPRDKHRADYSIENMRERQISAV